MITEAELLSLKPGDKVKVVDEWDEGGLDWHNWEGYMDRFLGQTVTVLDTEDTYPMPCIRIYEDQDVQRGTDHRGWVWNRYAIDYIVVSLKESMYAATDEDILKLFEYDK